MEENKALKNGMAKLAVTSKGRLKKWQELADSAQFQHADWAGEYKGSISGYLQALLDMGAIELDEAVELYQHYTE